MLNKKTTFTLTLAAVAALLAGAAVSSASALESNGSDQAMYQFDGGTGDLTAPGTVIMWDRLVVGGPNKTDIDSVFVGSDDAEEVRAFISARGNERTPSLWIGETPGGFVPGTKTVLQPNISPDSLVNGNTISVKNAGGDYSLGFAFVKNNALTIADAGVVYHHIHVTAGSGNYTFEDPTGTAVPVDPSLQGDINLEATTVSAADGVLSLDVPSNTTAVIGNPTLVGNLSTSTGTLGDFSVKDSRVLTHAGWTLTSTVTDFTGAGTTIDKKQLGVAPKIVSTTATGVTVSPAQTAGSGVYPAAFASATNAAQVGDTVFNADLKFVAPADKPAGTYTSKLTLTLASK